jgi:hypothetical protein
MLERIYERAQYTMSTSDFRCWCQMHFFFENVRIISTNRYNRKRKDIKFKKITDVTNDSFFVASIRNYLLLL